MIISVVYFIASVILAIEGYELLASAFLICSTAYDINYGLREERKNERLPHL